MAIPKIIHYCWFGPKPIPELELKCIETWKEFLPDYEIMFWNEETFDINAHSFAKQAYENKYYAFVSDVARAIVLSKYGGIYLDTDVEILSNFSTLLNDKDAVLGFENKSYVGTALMAFIPNHRIIIDFANFYKNRSFLSLNGTADIISNPQILAEILKKDGFILNGLEQEINKVSIVRREIFFPKKLSEGDFRVTKETLAIHHFEGSWLTPRQKRRGQNIFWIEICRPVLKKCKAILISNYGEERTRKMERNIKNWMK